MKSKIETVLLLLVGSGLLSIFLLLEHAHLNGNDLRGINDFVQFHVAANLVGTPGLYDRQANLAFQMKDLGLEIEHNLYTRPPFYAVLVAPLRYLSYQHAYEVYTLLSFLSVAWFAIRFTAARAELWFPALLFFPLSMSILQGQDTTFLLAFLGMSILASRAGKHFLAGLILSLCAIKFHLFIFVPLALIFTRRWRTIVGGICGVAGLFLIGVLVNGWSSTAAYIRVLRDPWINEWPTEQMPNIHGLVAVLHGGWVAEASLIAVTVILFACAEWMLRDKYELALSVALLAGLLVSFHSSAADDVLLLPVYVSIVNFVPLKLARILATLVMMPPFYLVIDGHGYGALPIALLLLLTLIALSPWTHLLRKPAYTPLPA